MASATRITLSSEEKETLLSWVGAGKTEKRIAERAQIILLASEGKTTKEIAISMNTRPARVSKWRTRFKKDGLGGLKDFSRGGALCQYDENTEHRILKVLDAPNLQ